MARQVNLLSALKISRLKDRGFYCDGGGLYLQVAPGGSKSWVFRFKENGKARDMGLGSLSTYTLAEAREKAREQRKLRDQGIDPIEARNAARAAQRLEAAKTLTFDECKTRYLADHSDTWKNPKHRQQWENTLATYVSPVIGSLPVQGIETAHVTKILNPIWKKIPETAGRVRGRIETILDWAKANGFRDGENPARWSGHLDHILPARAKVRKVRNHPALPYDQMAEFMADLRSRPAIAAKALDFAILTAARSGEARQIQACEIDLKEKLWTVPAERMKAKREHRVPLSDEAIAIIKPLIDEGHRYLFGGAAPISDMAMLETIRRMNAERKAAGLPLYIDQKQDRPIVPHGFRSSFKDWTHERTAFPNDLAEAALAHVNGDKVEAAYKRGDALEKRRIMMQAWATFCGSERGGQVVALRGRR